jgi:hypothetical protein
VVTLRKLSCALVASSVLAASTPARATGFTDVGDDLRSHVTTSFDVHGALRLRGEGLYNLDLDRGPTPSGQLFYPVPLGDPKGQWLGYSDMRLRLDMAGYALGGGVAVKVRVDGPDNVALGSDYAGAPASSRTTSMSPSQSFATRGFTRCGSARASLASRCRSTSSRPSSNFAWTRWPQNFA